MNDVIPIPTDTGFIIENPEGGAWYWTTQPWPERQDELRKYFERHRVFDSTYHGSEAGVRFHATGWSRRFVAIP